MTWQYLQHSCLGYVAFPAQAGCTYVFTYCNSVAPSAGYSGDPYLTINSSSPMAGAVAANDDYCGLGSYISWTAPATQTYYLQMGNWAQGASCACGQNRNLGYRSTNCVAGVQPPSGITASAMSVCQGQPVTLTATGTMGTQYWYTGSCGGTQIGTGASISVTPATTTTYYVNNNSGGQFSPSCASVTIIVNPSPPAPTVSGNLTICGTGSTTLTASGSSGNYLWYSNAAGTNQLATTAAYTTPILTTTTTYYLAATSAPPNQVPGNWTFTNCGATSNVGPTQVQCDATYGPGVVTVTGSGTQRWTVPQSGMYTITGRGASGGNANIALGGQGRVIQIQVALTAGHQIGMIVGQQGGQLQFNTGYAGSGGGGTFVYNYTTNQPILVCGGGGGAGKGSPSWNFTTNGGDAAPYNSTSGTAGLATPGSWCAVGAAGTGGNGGGGGNGGSGGGGLNGNGTQSTYGGAVGQSFISGGLGGTHTMYTGGVTSNVPGGFGGGAGAGGHNNYEANGGGGGGYSGGGGAACRVGGGGGGGNFFTGTYISNSLNTGQGSVTISGGIGGGNACISPIIPVTVVVNPQPTVTLTGTTICAGQSATLTANANLPGGTYVWSPGNLQGQSITVNPNTTTAYTVTYTSVGCPGATATATVTVNPMQPITGNLTICSGTTTQLSNPVAPSGSPWMSSNTAVATISPSGLVTGLSAGTTTITYSSSNGCQATAIVTVDGTPLLTVTPNNIACFGGSGSVTLSASGGTAPFNYGATPTTNLAPGSYTYVATSASGCVSLPVTITITQPQVGLTVTTTQTNVLCFGNSTGAINATPAGGSAPYTYSWSNGATTQNLTAIPSGSYTVTVTDANGCTATATVIITQPAAALAATTTQVMIACFGGNTGSVNMTPTGGTAPYTYVWTGGSTAQSAIGVPAGTYTVTVTDANGCTTTVTATITQPQAPLTLTNTQTNVSCFGNSTGAINLTPAGGTPAYSYLWSNNATTQNLTSLPAGTYTVVVTDANGCTANASVTITQPQTGLTVTTTQTNVLCFGNSTGAINATPAGGSAPYTYSWSNGATTQNLTAIPSGSYTVTVSDANGCTATATAIITQPAAVLAATTTQVMIACFGGNTGSVNMTPTGGTAPYTYVWTGGSTAQSAIGVPAGTYTVTVTDANGCTTTVTATITQPQAPLTLTNTQTNILCFGTSTGSINLTPAGGTPAYSYLWSNNATTQNLTSLAAGTYTVVVTDANGCTANASVTITQPQTGLSVATTQTNVLCFGNSTGAINATPSGGSAPYNYSWSNNATTQNLTAIASGSYTVTVLDANGCTATATAVITQPAAALAATTTQVNILCLNGVGSINLTVSGGTLGYTYLWSNQVTTEDLANLQAGVYTVVVTDANGCVVNATATILQSLSQVPVAINNLSGTTVLTCASPIINVQATGGVTYTWTGGSSLNTAANSFTLPGQYTVNMIDPNGCPVSQNITLTQNVVLPPVQITNNSGATVIDCNNATINLSASGGGQYAWNNGLGSLANVSIATAGTYTVVVTASNGCVDSSTVIVTVAPTPLVTISDTAICSGQSVTLSPNYFPGGVGGTIIWSTAQSTPTITVSPATTTTYNILYNYNGCPATEDVVVTVNQTPTVNVTNSTICLGDNAQLTATPNAPGGSYLWTLGGETTSSISISPATNTNYTVVYTLAGCASAPSNGSVTVNPIPTVTVNSITICQGDVDSLTATPNLPGGTYLWAQGGQTTSTIAVNPQLNSNYSVVYTLNGCVSNSAQGTVSVNPLPAAIFIADTLTGCAPLSVQFNADTTNQLATYQWAGSNGASGIGDQANLIFSNTGCYDITLTATMNGCVNSTTTNGYICVQENPTANFSTSINDFTQPNESVTFINTSIGASGYIWSFGDGTLGNEMNPIHLYSGTNNGFTVTLIATTSMGCMDSTSMTIGYEETASFYIPNTFTPDGDKFNQTFNPIFSSGIDYQNYTMLIYNRWGEIVFETHDVAIGWDGSYGTEGLDAQPGVYTYQIMVKIPETDERKIIAGHVNLLR
jgi:gliding motility-associated-like protein